jgi:hypothetical protein
MTIGPAGLAAAVALASVGIALAMVAIDRSGAPRAELSLSEREVDIVRLAEEDSSVRLRLVIDTPPAPDERGWLDREQLAALGFETASPPRRDGQVVFEREQTVVYVALELAGPAWESWQAWRRQQEQESTPAPDVEKVIAGHTRLFAVDAAQDADTLRRRHPDRTRTAIVPAVVTVHRSSSCGPGEENDGRCGRLYATPPRLRVDEVYVPLAHRDVVRSARSIEPYDDEPQRELAATVAWGRLFRPRVLDVSAPSS